MQCDKFLIIFFKTCTIRLANFPSIVLKIPNKWQNYSLLVYEVPVSITESSDEDDLEELAIGPGASDSEVGIGRRNFQLSNSS